MKYVLNAPLLALGLALPLLAACNSGQQTRLVENDEYGDWRANGSVRQRPLGASAGITVAAGVTAILGGGGSTNLCS